MRPCLLATPTVCLLRITVGLCKLQNYFTVTCHFTNENRHLKSAAMLSRPHHTAYHGAHTPESKCLNFTFKYIYVSIFLFFHSVLYVDQCNSYSYVSTALCYLLQGREMHVELGVQHKFPHGDNKVYCIVSYTNPNYAN